jgi:acyl homoserine lactone synthase
MVHTVIGTLADPRFAGRYADGYFRLRYRVFHERLHWNVQCHGDKEIDGYDDEHTVYVLTADDDDEVIGGWRLRPTLQPYMLEQVFPQLLCGAPVPRHPRIWESNRFVVDQRETKTRSYGFGEAAGELFRATAQYALEQAIDQYIMVLSAGVVRLVRHTGLVVHTYGRPVRIGEVLSVACRIDIDEHTRHVLLGHPLPLERAA